MVFFLASESHTPIHFWSRRILKQSKHYFSLLQCFAASWDLESHYKTESFLCTDRLLTATPFLSLLLFFFNSHLLFILLPSNFPGLSLFLHLYNTTSCSFSSLHLQHWQLIEPALTKLLLVLPLRSLSCLTCCHAKLGTVHYRRRKITTGKRLDHWNWQIHFMLLFG